VCEYKKDEEACPKDHKHSAIVSQETKNELAFSRLIFLVISADIEYAEKHKIIELRVTKQEQQQAAYANND
jgi:hypothetical protein